MTKATWYEWDFEPFDKHGDIVDHHHHAPGDLPKDINGYVKFAFGEDLESSMIEGVNLVLVKTRWEDNVWLLFRTWAYVESNRIGFRGSKIFSSYKPNPASAGFLKEKQNEFMENRNKTNFPQRGR